jgi:type II secretory pathway pseudopilin PulG
MIRLHGRAGKRNDSGYMLLVLMIAVAMLTITMLEVARNYKRSIQREREVEMIHRGEQYARAIKKYYIKFGNNYPTTIEQLEKTNNIRFLRKRYKDPMSPDGEWKLAHLADVPLKSVGGLSPTGGTTGGTATSPAGGTASGGTTTTSGQTQTDPGTPGGASNGGNQSTGGTTGTTIGNTVQGTGTGTGPGGSSSNPTNGNPVLGGGPILGVVSKMKVEGIHSFGDKSKYSEWFFIYDPSQDANGKMLVKGPYNPNTFIGSANSGLGNTGTTGNTQAPNTGAPGTTQPPMQTPTQPPAQTPTTP